jgi:hypothetical protein
MEKARDTLFGVQRERGREREVFCRWPDREHSKNTVKFTSYSYKYVRQPQLLKRRANIEVVFFNVIRILFLNLYF